MYIKRDLEKKLDKYFNFKEAIAVIGPRQSGKTTLVNKFLDGIVGKRIKRLSFEDVRVLELFNESIQSFIELYISGYDVVFIDEIQYSKDSGQKLKYIIDTTKVKLIISGSSAVELSLVSIKYLVGRIFVFTLLTLSFDEFLRFKNRPLFGLYQTGELTESLNSQVNQYIRDYITFGGYPRVALVNDDESKKEVLHNIFNIYMLKEISEIIGFRDIQKISRLVSVLALQTSKVLNYHDICVKTGISFVELKRILSILEQTFITKYANNFHSNKKVELTKSPKVYFCDLGFRNSILQYYNSDIIDGYLYENFVASQLMRKDIPLKYWRTKTKAEVDFILTMGEEPIPIEVKTKIADNSVAKSFRSFIERYSPERGFIVSADYEKTREVGSCSIEFLPYAKFLAELNEFSL